MLAYGKEGITADPMYQGIDRYENAYRLEKEHFLDVLEGTILFFQSFSKHR